MFLRKWLKFQTTREELVEMIPLKHAGEEMRNLNRLIMFELVYGIKFSERLYLLKVIF